MSGGQALLKSLCSWGSRVSDNVKHGAHSLVNWLDTMLALYLHADTHWTLIEIHSWGTRVEFQAAVCAGAFDSLLCA